MDYLIFALFVMVFLVSIHNLISRLRSIQAGDLKGKSKGIFYVFEYMISITFSLLLITHFIFKDFNYTSFAEYTINNLLIILFAFSHIIGRFLRRKQGEV